MPASDNLSSPLDAKVIENICRRHGCDIDVTVLQAVNSTNTWVMQEAQSIRATLCAAEQQTEGRGRRGKTWHSPVSAITFSVGFRSSRPVAWFGGLSLLTGAVVCDCLRDAGATDAMVKWPNDVLVGGSKLAGILIESAASSAGGDTTIVVGIGVNYRRGQEAQLIDQANTDLVELCGTGLPSRSHLIAAIASEVVRTMGVDVPASMRELAENWQRYDALAGRKLSITEAGKELTGVAAGIDAAGALRLQTQNGVESFNSADISIRSC